jgi:MoxR-like ATPase
MSIAEIEEKIGSYRPILDAVRSQVARQVIGQSQMVDRLLIGLLCEGHVLLEGVPGLAKTLTIRCLSDALQVDFRRIQFTPDLLPADVIGTQIYSPSSGSFTTHQGPIFSNIVLADEINRAPAKVQSALLEAMAERQVSIGGETHQLPDPFLVLATQNPLEQEGTYPLSEAQADRFLLKVRVAYPTREEERRILELKNEPQSQAIEAVTSPHDLRACKDALLSLRMEPLLLDYIVDLVQATREPAAKGLGPDLDRWIEFGASPRASIGLAAAARAHAFLQGRGFVTPDDVRAMAPDVLRHRLMLTYEAEAEGLDVDQVVQNILHRLPTP